MASLLPSATEIVRALGLESALVAVSHSCDFPGRVAALPRATSTRVPSGAGSREIDRIVRECVQRGESLYRLDDALLERLRPDVIVTQSLCEVCAVGPGEVERAVPALGTHPVVITLEPRTLDQVFESILVVGQALGRTTEAAALVRALRSRVEAVRARADLRRHLERMRPELAMAEGTAPDARLDRLDERARVRVRELWAGLPCKQREAVWRRWVEGEDYGFIAQELDMSIESARTNVYHGLSRLRSELHDLGEELGP